MKIAVSLLELPIVSTEERTAYMRLIPEYLYGCLDGIDPYHINAPIIAFGATLENKPIGIVLATAHTKVHTAIIHCLEVQSINALDSIEDDLLKYLTQKLIDLGTKLATFTYATNTKSANILERTFEKQHWKGPDPLIIHCLFKRSEFDPSWWYKKIPLDKDYEVFPWKNLREDEKKNLKHRYEQGRIPNYVYPFGKDQNIIEFTNSLGLRYKGEVVGWMITHRTTPHTIRYSALYLEDDHKRTRYWLKLLIDSLRRHYENSNADFGELEINLNQIPKGWLKFIEKRLFPYAKIITHKNQFWKTF